MSSTLPISLESAKRHLRVGDLSSDDVLIQEDLAMAFSIAETWTNRNIAPQTFSAVPMPVIDGKVYLSDIAGVQGVTDSEGNAIDYTVATENLLTTVTVSGDYDSVKVTYTVGFTSDTLPGTIRAAILLILGTLYDNEADTVVGRSVSQIPMNAKQLLMPWRLVNM